MQHASFHENLEREDEVVGSTDRGFGYVVAGVLAIVGAVKLASAGLAPAWPWAVAAALLALVGWVRPAALRPFNRLWTRFGLLLYRIVNPLVLGILFWGAIVPIGLVMRAFGKDFLRLKRDSQAASYWIAREPPGPAPGSMKNQF